MAGAQTGRTLLATFVHISDIHIGEIDPASGDARISALAAKTYSNMPWFDGLLGHHGRALQELDQFVDDLKAEETLRLIVSGDLSRFGASDELKDAQAYIENDIDLSPPLGNDFGLRFGQQALTIPGNHDQWGGAAHPFSSWPSQFGGVFPAPLPRIEQVPLDAGRKLVFICVDSDADVNPQTPNRWLAIGDFRSQLQALQAMLPAKLDGEFRVLLIHHSWFQQRRILRMTGASKSALEQFLVENEVSAMLCGHSHHPLLNSFIARGPLGSSEVYELRSGSTAQHDSVPYKWITALKKRPVRNWDPNSLIVHRVYDDPDAVRWHAELHARAPGGFKHVPQWDKEFALL
jgi:hypothetical protein